MRRMRSSKRDVFARFWSKVKIGRPDECWPYLGGLDNDGYGIFTDGGRHCVRANRFAFRLSEGHEARPMALHTCGNRPCCNPSHLYEGTARDNIDDCIRDGTFKTVFVAGEHHPNAKLTNAEINEALRLISLGKTQILVARKFGVTPGAIAYHRRKRQ